MAAERVLEYNNIVGLQLENSLVANMLHLILFIFQSPRGYLAPMRRLLLFAFALASMFSLSSVTAVAPEWLIRPERTDWLETTRNQEIIEFLERAAAAHPRIHFSSFGHSLEGNVLPLLIVGMDAPPSAGGIEKRDRLRIYIQGNIHAGEVAGKEALLRLIRDLAHGKHAPWTKDWVLLLAPNYNPDGNDRIHLRNRLYQHGPVGGMGTRENAQGLDLNRDQMKLDTPEARSLARLLQEWDPHVIIDLHTTNGTHHAYHLTYAPPLHPATPAGLDHWLRENLFPAVDRKMEERWGWHTFHYGNRFERNGVDGWWSFDCRPRFVTNYAGLRNRLGILSEAYSYLTFQDRVLATERFLASVLEVLWTYRDEVRTLVEEQDLRDLRGRKIPLTGVMPAQPPERTVLLGEVTEERHPYYGGEPLYLRRDTRNPVILPVATHFEGDRWIKLPEAYYLAPGAAPVVENLQAHGIRVDAPSDGETLRGHPYRIENAEPSSQPFQGRTLWTIRGNWADAAQPVPPGGWLVPLDQSLALLAALLLEPDGDDSLTHWGFLEAYMKAGAELPVWRIPATSRDSLE